MSVDTFLALILCGSLFVALVAGVNWYGQREVPRRDEPKFADTPFRQPSPQPKPVHNPAPVTGQTFPVGDYGTRKPAAHVAVTREVAKPFTEVEYIPQVKYDPLGHIKGGLDGRHLSQFIYFLTSGSDIVYIGKTNAPNKRRREHIKDGKDFDGMRYWPVPNHLVDEFERSLIGYYRPVLNSTFRSSGYNPDTITLFHSQEFVDRSQWLVE